MPLSATIDIPRFPNLKEINFVKKAIQQ